MSINLDPSKSAPAPLPSQFQIGECGLVTLGGVHMHAEVIAVHFAPGKVSYDLLVGDAIGDLRLTVPSERLNRSMDTMPGYAAPFAGSSQ